MSLRNRMIRMLSVLVCGLHLCAAQNAGSKQGQVAYVNQQYGFELRLPVAWRGFKVETKTWSAGSLKKGKPSEFGPLIVLHCPSGDEGLDKNIPIMVFTRQQWKRVDYLKTSAAQYWTGAIDRNRSYVFAMPAHWQFTSDMSPEEIGEILHSWAFHAYGP